MTFVNGTSGALADCWPIWLRFGVSCAFGPLSCVVQ